MIETPDSSAHDASDLLATAHRNVIRLRQWAASRAVQSDRRHINRLAEMYLREMNDLLRHQQTA